MRKKISILIVFVLIVILTSGCLRVNREVYQGGIYKSITKADSWEQKVALLGLPGQMNFIDNLEVNILVFDPQDSNTIYLGTKDNGLFVTYNTGDAWQKITRLNQNKINAVAIDPRAKHIVYVATANQIFKTRDANRTWQGVYLDAVPGVEIMSLAISPFLSNLIFAGTSDGRFIMSEDGGISWKNIQNFDGKIKEILINPNNSKIIYLNIESKGIYYSENQGEDWISLKEDCQGFSNPSNIDQIIFDPNFPDTLFSVCQGDIFKTQNQGKTWQQYQLLVSNNKLKINNLAINPQDSNFIYYLTNKALYKSVDGGENWITKPLPTRRIPAKIIIDPVNPDIVYLGVGGIIK